jgi:hypothetical protein
MTRIDNAQPDVLCVYLERRMLRELHFGPYLEKSAPSCLTCPVDDDDDNDDDFDCMQHALLTKAEVLHTVVGCESEE